jgi:hypothetical protein
MWNSNSVPAWLPQRARIDTGKIRLPNGGRARAVATVVAEDRKMEGGRACAHQVSAGRLTHLRPMARSPRVFTSTMGGTFGYQWLQVPLGPDAQWLNSSASQGQKVVASSLQVLPGRRAQ